DGGLAPRRAFVRRRHADRVTPLKFEILATDGAARRGRLTTAHGVVDTPVFMPVGTQATVKALTPEDLETAGAQVVLGNTYHLLLRPGPDVVRDLGGLHRFMGWHRAILTDSGGFQVFSLAKLRKPRAGGQALLGIIQGGTFDGLRAEAVERTVALGFDGYAIGGLAVGESKPAMLELTARVAAALPADRPRYLMGIGKPEDLVESVAR